MNEEELAERICQLEKENNKIKKISLDKSKVIKALCEYIFEIDKHSISGRELNSWKSADHVRDYFIDKYVEGEGKNV